MKPICKLYNSNSINSLSNFLSYLKKNNTYYKIYFLILILIPIILLILPKNFFDNGKSFCLSILIFNTKCPGCGMTKAIHHLIHFDLKTALYYNKLVLIVFPLLVYLWLIQVLKLYKKIFLKK